MQQFLEFMNIFVNSTLIFYHPQTKFRARSVCLSVHMEACVAGNMHGRGSYMAGACVVGDGMHAGEMATEGGGTHPTGMHSCFPFFSQLRKSPQYMSTFVSIL